MREWYARAIDAGLADADAMALATATPDGVPSVRMVLLKAVDERGIQFFTNYESRKGRELAANPRAATAFYWHQLGRQMRLEGAVERLTAQESDAYFATRARGSRLGAWASRQGRPIPSSEALDAALADAERRFEGEHVPRPDYWGGYRLVPDAVELWEQRPNRLHERVHFLREPDGTWRSERLSP